MSVCMNLTTCEQDLSRFADAADLRAFYQGYGLDGVELMPMDCSGALGLIPPEAVVGVHLSMPPCWLDFYRGDARAVLREFGSMDVVETVFGGRSGEVLVKKLRAQLDFAEKWRARYVVFHVSDISLQESVSYRFLHTDEEVARAAVTLINGALDGRAYSFDFLVENLWWPGFTMTRPDITRALLAGVKAERKGIMLDTGHLLNTHRALETQADGIRYIRRMLHAHGALCRHIKGVHLHQSLSGAHVENMLSQQIQLTGDYWARLDTAYRHVLNIDRHEPFDEEGVRGLIEEIAPAYLTYEFITRDRREHAGYLQRQCEALKRGCPPSA